MSKQSRGDRGEQIVIAALSKRKEYFKLLNDLTFVTGRNEMSHQIDHIYINRSGVFVLETKNYMGVIDSETNDSYWLKILRGEKVKISNPVKQNRSHAYTIFKLLNKQFEVIPAVIFVRDNAPKYSGEENVINLKDLYLFIDSHPAKKTLSKKEIDMVAKKLVKESSNISKKDHVENIEILKKVKEEFRKEVEYAMMSRRCPRCDGKIIEKNGVYRCEYCNFKFKF